MPRTCHRIIKWLLFSLAALALAGCSSPAPALSPTATPTRGSSPTAPLSTDSGVPTLAAGTAPAATETAILPIPRYTITATLDYDRHFIEVRERIEYTNRTGEALPELALMVDAAYYPGAFQLHRLGLGGGEPLPEGTWEGGILKVPLPQPLQPEAAVEIEIDFAINLPSPVPSAEVRPIPFGYTARQTNLVDWYPFIPPYRAGQGWLAHRAGYFGEHLVYEIADFDVRLRLAGGRSDLIVAAAATSEPDGEWQRYRLDRARNFAFSVSHAYSTSTRTVGEVTITGYYLPLQGVAGEAALQATADALALYNELFGPYPRRTLAVVEADFLDGMEYDGLYFLSNGFYNTYSGLPGDYLIAIAAHETAHQWWYARVGNDQALEPWLDEALCTYSERLFYERFHPDALPWWWGYRVNYYDPRGMVDGSIYNPYGYRSYRDAVYLNGAVFLEELRALIGDEPFFAFLKSYAGRFNGAIATADDFFDLLAAYTDADLAPLLDAYFENR